MIIGIVLAFGLVFLLVGAGFRDRAFLNLSSFFGAFLFTYGMGFFLQLLDNMFDTFELVQVNYRIVP